MRNPRQADSRRWAWVPFKPRASRQHPKRPAAVVPGLRRGGPGRCALRILAGRISESLTIGAVGARRLRRAGEPGSEGRA